MPTCTYIVHEDYHAGIPKMAGREVAHFTAMLNGAPYQYLSRSKLTETKKVPDSHEIYKSLQTANVDCVVTV